MYIVIELQKNSDGTLGNIVRSFDERSNAESAYHLVLASAAVSEVEIHSAVLMSEDGLVLRHQSYRHGDAEQTEPEV